MLRKLILSIVRDVIRDNISRSIMFHMLINIIITAIVKPWIMLTANSYFISNDVSNGIKWQCFYLLMCIVDNQHSYRFIVKRFIGVNAKIYADINIKIKGTIFGLDTMMLNDLLNEDLESTYQPIVWNIWSIVSNLITSMVQIISLISSIAMILSISPMSLIIFVCVLCAVIYIYPLVRPKLEIKQVWEQNAHYNANFFHSVIHFETDKILLKMKDLTLQAMGKESIHELLENEFFERINLTFNATLILILWLFISRINNSVQIQFFLYHATGLMGGASTFINIYRQYLRTLTNLQKLEDKIPNPVYKQSVSQFKGDIEKINFSNLSFTYDSKPEFHVRSKSNVEIEIEKATTTFIDGKSGNGKSTLLKILAGFSSLDNKRQGYKCSLNVKVNGDHLEHGFQALEESRYYADAKCFCWTVTPCEIITSKCIDDLNDKEKAHLKRALELADANDFMKIEKVGIKASFSEGQQRRIVIARAIYHILTKELQMVILDEIDSNLQKECCLKIVNNILDLVKEKRIICFIVAHTSAVRRIKKIDHILAVNKGLITMIR